MVIIISKNARGRVFQNSRTLHKFSHIYIFPPSFFFFFLKSQIINLKFFLNLKS